MVIADDRIDNILNLDFVAFCRQNHEDCLGDELIGEYKVKLDESKGLWTRAKKKSLRKDWRSSVP
jgi:hypothetical protein